jgi:glycosyltransferase involved in cell wall biosynthesis
MIICQVITSLVFGGAEKLLVNYSNVLVEEHELYVIYLKGEPKLKELLDPRIKVFHVPLGWRCAAELRKLILLLNPDIVHTHLGHADLIGLWASRRLPVKLFCTMHNVYFKWNWSDKVIFFLYYLTFKLHARSCKVSCISSAVASHVNRTLGVKKENIRLIHNCVPNVTIRKTREELREKLNVGRNDFCLLTIGRFRIQKSIETLLLSVPHMEDRITNLKVIIVGEGEQAAELRELTEKLNISDVVEFRGVTLHPEEYLACADVFILSSVFEGLPTVVLESFRAALPVVASDIDGVNELVKHEVNGMLFPVKQEKLLAKNVITLYEHPEQRRALGENGYRDYRVEYSIDNYATQTVALYNE